MVNKQKYIERLRKLRKLDDTEVEHAEADEILVEILVELGMQDIVDEYGKIPKWYA